MGTFVPMIVVLFCVSAFAQDKPKPDEKLKPAKWTKVQPLHVFGKVFLGGQPSPLDLQQAKKEGVRTVINLREKQEIDYDEEAEVKRLELGYLHIPFRSVESLKDEVFDQVRKALKDQDKHPVLLHCASGNRVGAVWMAYRVLDHGVNYHDALAEAKTVGLKSQPLIDKAKDYIERKRK